ncbi:phage baseplate assembly protein V [Streptomyces sp. BH055]|uniref:phage baseplate assembly protein V n=1 Tax=unclassified Streptomyces TaxID=2593676 RepID=UPI003BB4BDB3
MADQYFGKYSATVEDNRDADKLGILQVSVPTIFPPDELVPARAALPYGMFFVPENGTHIWVEFEGGDTEFPLWTGVQHIAGTFAPEAAKNPPTVRAFRTPTGHLLVFDDTSGSESVVLTDGAHTHKLTFDKNGVTLTDGTNKHVIELTSSAVHIKHGKGVAKVTLEAAAVKAEAGPSTLELSASMAKVDGPTVVLGAGAQPVLHLTDQGVGNLGAPVPITLSSQVKVLA